jgi:GAF domain-containing protein
MSESISVPNNISRAEMYRSLVPQIQSLVHGEPDFIANTSNIIAALKQAFGFFWIGCYFVKNNELVLGPFQGPVACTRIQPGKGVCGTAWQKKTTIVVPDVDLFPGHIACSADSRSEIVVPLIDKNGDVFGVLDVDSNLVNDFNETDSMWLGVVADIIALCQLKSQE